MKRSLSLGFLLSLLLTACVQQQQTISVPKMDSEEVLRKAAQASQLLESARFAVKGTFSLSSDVVESSGSADIEGVISFGGKQVQSKVAIEANLREFDGDVVALSVLMEVISAGKDDVYLQMQNLSAEPSSTFIDMQALEPLMGSWWRFPPSGDDQSSSLVSPDPKLLYAQSQVVRVDNDRGAAMIRDRLAYHYDVSIDKEKLLMYLATLAEETGEVFDLQAMQNQFAPLEAQGELWIDAETFYIHRLSWNVQSFNFGEGNTLSGSFRIDLSDFNTAPDILLPQDAEIFSLLPFMGVEAIPTLDEPLSGDVVTEDELIDQIIDNMLTP